MQIAFVDANKKKKQYIYSCFQKLENFSEPVFGDSLFISFRKTVLAAQRHLIQFLIILYPPFETQEHFLWTPIKPFAWNFKNNKILDYNSKDSDKYFTCTPETSHIYQRVH